MKKNGFTLVELLAVIVILGILIVLAGSNVFRAITKSKNTIAAEETTQLIDGGISYAQENLFLKKCSKDWTPESVDDTDVAGCTATITTAELIDEGFFRDDKESCKEDAKVLIYRYYNVTDDGDIVDEIKAYASEDSCYVE